MFCFLFLVVDAGASDTERRDWSIFVFVVLDVDVERHAPEVGFVKVLVNFGCRWNLVGIALVEHVVGQHQLVHELDQLPRTRERGVGELGLHAVVLATEVNRVVEVVGVARLTVCINLPESWCRGMPASHSSPLPMRTASCPPACEPSSGTSACPSRLPSSSGGSARSSRGT